MAATSNSKLSEDIEDLEDEISALREEMEGLVDYMKRIVDTFSDYDVGEDPYD